MKRSVVLSTRGVKKRVGSTYWIRISKSDRSCVSIFTKIMIERLTLGWEECESKVHAKTYLLMSFHHSEDMT